MENYLKETPSIDYVNPLIQDKVWELMSQSEDNLDYIKRSYIFVRDEIPHSWDIKAEVVTRADDASEGYMIHALNTAYIKDLNKWIRLDARGNKENVNAQFSLDEECLAYSIRSELGEIDYHDNHSDLDERLINILNECESIFEISTDFEF